jgi:hypothetical protein
MNGLPRGGLRNVREIVMVRIRRGDDEEFQFAFFEASTPDGKSTAWHAIRIFRKNDRGEWVPGKDGVTIRSRELRPLLDALIKATSGGHAPPPRQELLHERSR